MLEKSPNITFVEGVHGLRAVAAIAVVLFHSGGAIADAKYQGLSWVAQITSGLDSGVDLFFVISGFVIALPFFKGRKIKISDFLLGRFLRIYPLSALTAIIFLCAGWAVYGRMPTADQIYSSILLLPNGTNPVPIVLWTLKQELLFYAVFSLIFFSKALGFSMIAVWSIFSIIITSRSPVFEWIFNGHNVQFVFGIGAAFIFVRTKLSKKLALSTLLPSVIFFLITSYNSNHDATNISHLLLGFWGACIVLGVAFFGVPLTNSIMFLGTASYSIYLIHYFFVSIGNKLIMKAIPSAPGVVSLLLLTAFSIMAGCIYFLVFERSFERLRRRVTIR